MWGREQEKTKDRYIKREQKAARNRMREHREAIIRYKRGRCQLISQAKLYRNDRLSRLLSVPFLCFFFLSCLRVEDAHIVRFHFCFSSSFLFSGFQTRLKSSDRSIAAVSFSVCTLLHFSQTNSASQPPPVPSHALCCILAVSRHSQSHICPTLPCKPPAWLKE